MDVRFDLLLRGGRVIDPATGRDGVSDIGVRDGVIAAIEPAIPGETANEILDVAGKIVTAGMIDSHAHVYQHVTGRFGLNADMVGVRSGVTTLVDQGGPSCMTLPGFRHFIVEPAESRVLCFISMYLVGGMEGHLYPALYGPEQVDVKARSAPDAPTPIWCAALKLMPKSAAPPAGGSMSSNWASASPANSACRCTFTLARSGH